MKTIATLNGPALPPASGGPARQIVMLLHGYGSNGADMMALAPLLRAELPDALFLAPNAPERCPGVPGGFQWWGLESFDRAALAAGARRAGAVLDAYLDALIAEHALGEDRMVLIGFSQGTMMALHIGLRRRRRLAGIVGYSGMLADPAGLDDVGGKPPVLLIHGAADTIVPLRSHDEAIVALRALGIDVAAHVSPGLGHSVDETGLALGREFVSRVLGTAAL